MDERIAGKTRLKKWAKTHSKSPIIKVVILNLLIKIKRQFSTFRVNQRTQN
jgi:hypothetical protein